MLDELRRRHGLDLVSVRAGEHGGSRVVAHVRDPDGRDLLLKHTIPNRGAGELAALRAWSETGRAAHFYAELAPDVYLAEWLLGPSLAEIPRHQTVDDAAIGGMLRELHLVGLPPGLRPVRDRFAPGIVETWPQLPPPMGAGGERPAGGLYAYDPQHDVLLHGDRHVNGAGRGGESTTAWWSRLPPTMRQPDPLPPAIRRSGGGGPGAVSDSD